LDVLAPVIDGSAPPAAIIPALLLDAAAHDRLGDGCNGTASRRRRSKS
jgi:hypothetical protein